MTFRTMLAPLLLTLALLFVTGCSDEPDKEWALETYSAHKATLDKVQEGLTKEFETFAPVPFQKHPEDPAKRDAFVKAQNARRDTFDEKALALLEGEDKIIGWELSYSFPEHEKPPIPYTFEKASTHKPAWKPGTVRADRRDTKKDGRQLGWGMFLIPGAEKKTSLGMEIPNYHKGLEVVFSIPHEEAQLDVVLFLVPERNDQ